MVEKEERMDNEENIGHETRPEERRVTQVCWHLPFPANQPFYLRSANLCGFPVFKTLEMMLSNDRAKHATVRYIKA